MRFKPTGSFRPSPPHVAHTFLEGMKPMPEKITLAQPLRKWGTGISFTLEIISQFLQLLRSHEWASATMMPDTYC